MYDKSKKTWSQRLKITKTEKNSFGVTASVTRNSSGVLSSTVANNVSTQHQQHQQHQQQHQQLFQIQQFTTNTGSSAHNSAQHYQAMHLPNSLQFTDYQNIGVGYTTDYMSGTTSRAMKYAEPWIYSTVRGIPARPYHHHLYQQTVPSYSHPHAAAIFASPPLSTTEALAVVICSCPEYLNGTKRDVKKASICKKCKGSRLPLATLGGIMPAAKLRANGNTAAATMRVVSMTKKCRPTILDPQKDPYDLMRRTRLLSPEPTVSSSSEKTTSNNVNSKSRNRGKSVSPSRGRTRTRHQLPPPAAATAPATQQKKVNANETLRGTSSVSAQDLQDCWLVEDDETLIRSGELAGDSSMMPSSTKNTAQSRRSILRCNVNPYDLISIDSNQEAASKSSKITTPTKSKLLSASQNEFIPPNDDDFNVEDAALNEDEPPFIIATKNHDNKIRNTETLENNTVNRNKSAGSKTTLKVPAGTARTTKKNQQQNMRRTAPNSPVAVCSAKESGRTGKTSVNSNANCSGNENNIESSKLNYSNVQAIAGQRISLGKQSSTKKSLIKQSGDGNIYESIIIGDEDNIKMNLQVKDVNNRNSTAEEQQKQQQQLQPKRPPRSKLTKSDSPEATITMNETTCEMLTNLPTVTLLTLAPTQNIKSILKRPSSKSSNNGDHIALLETNEEVDGTISKATKALISQKESTLECGIKSPTSLLSINQTLIPTTAAASSQFYIPLPQSRKKVQFMMEDEVIQHTIDCSNNDTDCAKKQPNRYRAYDSAAGNSDCDDGEGDGDGDGNGNGVIDVVGDATGVAHNNFSINNNNNEDAGNMEPSVSFTNNYEYYNKKRQQHKPSLALLHATVQASNSNFNRNNHHEEADNNNDNDNNNNNKNDDFRMQHTITDSAIESSATPLKHAGAIATIQAAVLEEIQQESFLVSKVLNEIDTKIYKQNGNNTENCIEINKEISDTLTVESPKTTNVSADASVINSMVKANHHSTSSSEQHNDFITTKQKEKFNNTNTIINSHSKQDQRIMNQQNLRTTSTVSKSSQLCNGISSSTSSSSSSSLSSSTSVTTAASTVTTLTSTEKIRSTSSALLMPSTILSPLQIKIEVDDQLATDVTVASRCDVNSCSKIQIDGYYDDIACKKLQALVESDSTVRVTQSRNPIRRSHSERMPVYNKLTSACIENTHDDDDSPKGRRNTYSKHSHNNNNGGCYTPNGNSDTSCKQNTSVIGLNFKDTTALRLRNNHKDSRNIFAQNNSTTMSTCRPREPPPPPPPAPAPTPAPSSSSSSPSPTTSSTPPTSTIVSPTISTRGDVASSVESAIEKPTTVSTRAASTTTTAAAQAKTSVAATSSSKEEKFLSLSPSAQAHSTDNDDKENKRRKQTFSLVTPTPVKPATTTTPEVTTPTPTTTTTMNDMAVAIMRKNHYITSGSGLDSKKQCQHEQNSLLECAEALHTNEKNQNEKKFIDKSVLSRKSNATSTAEPAAAPTTEIERAIVDTRDTKLISDAKPQQLLTEKTQHSQQIQQTQPYDETTICALDSKTIPKDYVRSSSSSTTTTTMPNSSQQRTVVRVAPFNKSSSEVHRLKINHTDDNDSYELTTSINQRNSSSSSSSIRSGDHPSSSSDDNESTCTQKKTSILINGDDCYSTMNLGLDASTPIYQSSVVVADCSTPYSEAANANAHALTFEGLKVTTTSNMVTINLSSPRSAEEQLIEQHNKINRLRTRQAKTAATNGGRAIIPIKGTLGTFDTGLHRSASSTSSASNCSSSSESASKRGRTLIKLDYEEDKLKLQSNNNETATKSKSTPSNENRDLVSHEAELLKILRNPVEAVKRNLVPHVCGKNDGKTNVHDYARNRKMKDSSRIQLDVEKPTKALVETQQQPQLETMQSEAVLLRVKEQEKTRKPFERNSFIAKLLEDPTLGQVADGLETETVVELIENSLKRLKESRNAIDITGTKDNDDINRLISISLRKIQEERQAHLASMNSSSISSGRCSNPNLNLPTTKEEDRQSNRGSISSANSFASANNYELFEFDANESDCYQSCSSEITTPGEDDVSVAEMRSKFYQLVVDATLAEIELCTNMDDDTSEHHYESIRNNNDPIYEEITDMAPPLPLSAPPIISNAELDKKAARSIFEGASKYDILSYLVEAKERGVVREESFEYPLNCSNPIIIEEDANDTLSDLGNRKLKKNINLRSSSMLSGERTEDNQRTMSSLSPPPHNFGTGHTDLLTRKNNVSSNEIERNDSGVGSETSKCSRSKYQCPSGTNGALIPKNSPIHLCEDCDGPVETQITDAGVMFAPLVCRKCGKKRIERKEIITEIVETEEKYGRDLQIILEEFYHPMLVAGLLTQEQLSAIFLNTEELLENNQTLAEKMRDALDIALEQADDDLLTVNIGRIFLDFTQMLHAFESYCVRQAGASLLLANLEKEKELLRIFLKVSQMENAVLRRMNLNSFLMVPVQRVTKYPLLLARLYKVTPTHLEGRDLLKQAQEKIELHLNHINQEAKDVPTKLWRRISSSSPNRRASCEIDMINIKLRKMAIDILEWNHDEVRFAMEGKLLYTQPTDSNWKKARSIKLTPVNALLVTNGKPSVNYKAEKISDKLNFPKHTGIREASLLVVKEKCGRYTLIREPLYLDRCVVCSEADWDDYFELQEISSKDTFIFKAEDGVRTKQWYTQLQYHAQGMGAWRKRRNALANIMINGMLTRT